MSFAPDEFLACAKILVNGADEAHWRSAVSRAYYAAFHKCRDWHGRLPAPGSASGHGGGTHQVLVNQLANPAPEVAQDDRKKSKMLSYLLGAAKTLRHSADYELDWHLDQATCSSQVANIEALVKRV